ncbi:MAG TPA: hypothetical protein VH598_15335 [Verrucomicrobiae bacterium]|nr:hypothetical protein [Verrucomicrobiae bacterium]
MSTTAQPSSFAWEPLTPRGVAAFARASLGRLWLAQLIVALLAGAVTAWFLYEEWLPVFREGIRHLPAQGEIRNARLDWRGDSPAQLAGNHFLRLVVDLNHGGELGHQSHLQIELGRTNVEVISLLGYLAANYPANGALPFNRTQLAPWWGAWEPAILAGAGLLATLALLLVWTALATLYCVPVWIIVFFQNRDLNLRQSWRLAGAALMPGALFLIAALLSYSFGWLDLIQLGAAFGLHFVIGWIYLFLGPMFLPRDPQTPKVKSDPFADSKALDRKAANPFSPPADAGK